MEIDRLAASAGSARDPVRDLPAFPLLRIAALAFAVACAGGEGRAQGAATRAPADAPSSAAVTAPDEPGEPLVVEGTVYGADGATPLAGASVYAYHTDAAGSYGPGGNRAPRLRVYLRTDRAGRYRFATVKPAPYPGGGIPAHIHFHVAPPEGGEERVTEVVFEGEPWVTDRMRASDFYAVLPLERGPDGALRCVYDPRLPAE
jgi:protocatechuate 3,4-dioxygenase beta subunit